MINLFLLFLIVKYIFLFLKKFLKHITVVSLRQKLIIRTLTLEI